MIIKIFILIRCSTTQASAAHFWFHFFFIQAFFKFLAATFLTPRVFLVRIALYCRHSVQGTNFHQSWRFHNITKWDRSLCCSHCFNLPATSVEFRKAQTWYQILSKVINFCQTKWPDELAVSTVLKLYWEIWDEPSICKQLLRGDRIVIPSCLQKIFYSVFTKVTKV